MRASVSQFFEEVSEAYDSLDLHEMERRTSVIEEAAPTVTDPQLLKQLRHSSTILIDCLGDVSPVLELMKYSEVWTTEENYMLVFKKTLLIRMEQNASVLIYPKGCEPEARDPSFNEFMVPNAKTGLNFKMLHLALNIEKQYLIEFRKLTKLIRERFEQQEHLATKELIIEAKTSHSKVYTICEQFPAISVFPPEDLLNFKDVFCERWEQLKDFIRFRCYGSQGVVTQSFLPLKEQIIWANAMMNRLHEGSNLNLPLPKEILSYLRKGFTIIQMLFLKDQARKEAEKLISEPSEALTRKIWNLTDQGFTKHMLNLVFPSITYSKKVYVPRVAGIVGREYIKQLADPLNQPSLDISQLEESLKVKHDGEYRTLLYKPNSERVLIRINCPFELENRVPTSTTLLDKITGLFKIKPDLIENVVLHVHGGGFIGMSSYSHQIYTRKWANELKLPVFSVDYRKAPEFPYPMALDDCLEAYLWLVYVFPQIFMGSVKKIILVGDSAGGNLIAALTNLIIRLDLRKPDGIFMIYPALNLDQKAFTPSLLYTLDDYILPHTYLKLCAKAYCQGYSNRIDYFLSPIMTPNNILEKYPFTRIYVGSRDPFSDDCFRLTERLAQLNCNVQLTLYQSFTHGFLQFDNAFLPILQARQAVNQICSDMDKFIR